MRPEFSRYTNIPYDFDAFPSKVDVNNAPALNCISLIHKVYKVEFGAPLPKGLWAIEILNDNGHFFVTDKDGIVRLGSVLVFAGQDPETKRKDPGNYPVYHLALSTGQRNETGDPLLLHTTDLNGRRSTIWPLRRFLSHPSRRWEKLYAIKELEPDLFRAHIAPFI